MNTYLTTVLRYYTLQLQKVESVGIEAFSYDTRLEEENKENNIQVLFLTSFLSSSSYKNQTGGD